MDTTRPALFEPLSLGSEEVRNRLWASPMTQYSALEGLPSQWHLIHLSSLAIGGAGLVLTEATAVSEDGRVTREDTGIYSDAHVAQWAPIVESVRSHGAIPAIQLSHGGRKASQWRPWTGRRGSVTVADGGWVTRAPSAIAHGVLSVPEALGTREISELVRAFGLSAHRAVNAGFRVIELHAAHGYLLHQFLSPLSNTRQDAYGGSLRNRARFLLQVIEEIRERTSDVALLVRLSATDYVDDGWDLEQSVALIDALKAHVDLFDISSGGLASDVEIKTSPGYQVPFARAVKERTGVLTSAVGLITDGVHANEVVSSGAADVVMVGRELLRNPRFPLHVANQLGIELPYWPYQYARVKTQHARIA